MRVPPRQRGAGAGWTRVVASGVLIGAWLLGCAGPAEKYDRDALSDRIEEQTGYAIGPGAESDDPLVPDGIEIADGVTRSEAVAIALWNNAAFQEAVSSLGLQRADLIQAGLLTNPTFAILFPLGPKQLEFAGTWPFEALWLRWGRLEAAELDCRRVTELLVEHGLDLVRDVKRTFAGATHARALKAFARETAELLEAVRDLEEARLRAGEVSELTASFARVDALRARAEVRRLEGQVALLEEQLRGLLGFARVQTELLLDPEPEGPLPPLPPSGELVRRALASRPEVRAAELAIDAAGERAGLADWDFLHVAAVLDANGEGLDGFESGPGINFTIPLFDQGQGRRAKERAGLEIAARHYLTVRDGVATGVRAAREKLLEVHAGYGQWHDRIVPALRDSVRRAELAYRAGQLSRLDLLQGQRQLLLALSEEVSLRRDLRLARGELERQLGHELERLPELSRLDTSRNVPGGEPTPPE